MSEWKKVKIGEIFKIEKGSLQSSKCIPGKYDFITAASEWKTHESYSHECEAIVYAVAASGSLGRAHYVNGKFIASDLCFILTEKDKEKYPINFQFYQLIFELIREEIVSKTKTGTSKESINQKNFSNYEIPYFSFDYQMANYEKLVNTKQKISELLEESEKQKSYVKQLRQNILQEAIEGKLTEEWRKENPVVKGNPDFDAESLFEKIQEEKLKIESGKGKKLVEKIQNPLFFEKLKIPNNWKYPLFTQITKQITDGTHLTPNYVSDGEIFLSAQNVKPFKFMPEMHRFVSKIDFDKYRTNRIPEKNDILMARVGAGIGEAAVIDCDLKFAFYVSLCLIKTFSNYVDPKYLTIVLNSSYGTNHAKNNISSSGSSAGNYNLGHIRALKIPLPPLAEQKEIVSRVEKLLANVAELEEQIAERETLTKQMLQSIMKDAFREE